MVSQDDAPTQTDSFVPYFSDQEESSDLISDIGQTHSNVSADIPLTIPEPDTSLSNIPFATDLPHYPYHKLEETTYNFSENKTLLGSGAYGKVFLAIGLLDQPVAVKKLIVNDMISESVTKQFKNEVEVLYKYKHDNLVSLLGYSCDSAYCLVYEYIPGGSLFEVLQVSQITKI